MKKKKAITEEGSLMTYLFCRRRRLHDLRCGVNDELPGDEPWLPGLKRDSRGQDADGADDEPEIWQRLPPDAGPAYSVALESAPAQGRGDGAAILPSEMGKPRWLSERVSQVQGESRRKRLRFHQEAVGTIDHPLAPGPCWESPR